MNQPNPINLATVFLEQYMQDNLDRINRRKLAKFQGKTND